MIRTALAVCVAVVSCTRPAAAPAPVSVVAELLATDRRFGTEARARDGVEAIGAMLDEAVILPVQAGFVTGRAAAVAALRQNPQNAASRLEWEPLRGGVSADGRHGFTFGYMTQRAGDSTHTVKYLAYWIRRPEGWRVATYRRRRGAAPGARGAYAFPHSVPAQGMRPTTDPSVLEEHRRSVAAAEKAFSDSAQRMGLGPAFELFGRADAINMGGPATTGFVIGSAAIGRAVGAGSEGKPSPVSWAADHAVLAASSGDLGVTFGFIRPNAAGQGAPAGGFPFFTIWKREPGGPWRYIAE